MSTSCRVAATVLALVLIAAATASAQVPSGSVVIGVNVSTFADSGYGASALGYEVGWLVGFSLELPVSRRVSLQPEVVYSHKGNRVETPPAPGSTPFQLAAQRLEYVEVPLLIRVGATAGRGGIYALAGPAIAALARARE